MSVSLIDGHIDDDVMMTDNEIIKAYELCHSDVLCDETNCPFFAKCKTEDLSRYILDLIKHQKAEIERLQNILLKFMDEVARWEEKNGLDVSELPLIPICDKGRDAIDHHRAVAIKGFAKRLKKNKYYGCNRLGYGTWVVEVSDIDNLVKEMVGE